MLHELPLVTYQTTFLLVVLHPLPLYCLFGVGLQILFVLLHLQVHSICTTGSLATWWLAKAPSFGGHHYGFQKVRRRWLFSGSHGVSCDGWLVVRDTLSSTAMRGFLTINPSIFAMCVRERERERENQHHDYLWILHALLVSPLEFFS